MDNFYTIDNICDQDIFKMEMSDLKWELQYRNLPIHGSKAELQERLQTAILEREISLEDSSTSGDQLLDDIVFTDDEEQAQVATRNQETNIIVATPNKVLTSEENALNLSVSTTAKESAASPEELLIIDEENNTLSSSESNEGADNVLCTKLIRLSELSMKERLEMRVKKFGLKTRETSIEEEQKEIQILKKRAERFGCVVSPKLAAFENQEKLRKRQERFEKTPAPVSIKRLGAL